MAGTLIFKIDLIAIEIVYFIIQHFPKRQILDSSKLKEFADDNLRLG